VATTNRALATSRIGVLSCGDYAVPCTAIPQAGPANAVFIACSLVARRAQALAVRRLN
jgi:hypothetical protein